MTTNTFIVTSLVYDQSDDHLLAKFYRSESTGEPGYVADPEDSNERFEVALGFSDRVTAIRDVTDHAGDVEPHYPAQVLLAFCLAWNDAYGAELVLSITSGPGDVQPFTFTVEC